MTLPIEVLLLADTHLGFDLPRRPRLDRARRGHDFLACYAEALGPAERGEVDLVVHGGDLFDRSRPSAWLVEQALAPLRRLAASGVPVVVVAGNHERSRLPRRLLALERNLHVLETPRTVELTVRGQRVRISGFPFHRQVDPESVRARIREAGFDGQGDLVLLLMHQAVGGAHVGAHRYQFRAGPEVVDAALLPPAAAVLCGHVHRAQLLRRDDRGRALASPVIYPGSIERTAFAERDEQKGYVRLTFEPGPKGGRLRGARFVRLPARPMTVLELEASETGDAGFEEGLRARLAGLPPRSVVQLRLVGGRPAWPLPSAAALRALAPADLHVEWGAGSQKDRSR